MGITSRTSIVFLFNAVLTSIANNPTDMDTESNKNSALAFYQMAFLGEPRRAAELYLGEDYIQHNPDVGDGIEGFVDYFERMQRDYPDKSIRFLRSVAEGEFVALHTHQVWPDGDEYVTMDFFRFDYQGKIVEHWDAIQQIPTSMAHENGMT